MLQQPARLPQAGFALAAATSALSAGMHAGLSKDGRVRVVATASSGLMLYTAAWFALIASDYVVANGLNLGIRHTLPVIMVMALVDLFTTSYRHTAVLGIASPVFFAILLPFVPFRDDAQPMFTCYELMRAVQAVGGAGGAVVAYAVPVLAFTASALVWTHGFRKAAANTVEVMRPLFRALGWFHAAVHMAHLLFLIPPLNAPLSLTTVACCLEFLFNAVTPLALIHFMSLSTDAVADALKRRKEDRAELEMARRAAETRREWLKYIFHEIRNPFGAFDLALDALRNSDAVQEDDDALHTIAMMQLASDTMAKIMNSVLDLEKIDSGNFTLELAPFSVNTMLQAVINNTASRASAASAAVTMWVDPRLPPDLLGDQHRILQCVLNFTTNAIKFLPADGTGRVTIRATLVSERDERRRRSTKRRLHAHSGGAGGPSAPPIATTGAAAALAPSGGGSGSGGVGASTGAGAGAGAGGEVRRLVTTPSWWSRMRPVLPDVSQGRQWLAGGGARAGGHDATAGGGGGGDSGGGVSVRRGSGQHSVSVAAYTPPKPASDTGTTGGTGTATGTGTTGSTGRATTTGTGTATGTSGTGGGVSPAHSGGGRGGKLASDTTSTDKVGVVGDHAIVELGGDGSGSRDVTPTHAGGGAWAMPRVLGSGPGGAPGAGAGAAAGAPLRYTMEDTPVFRAASPAALLSAPGLVVDTGVVRGGGGGGYGGVGATSGMQPLLSTFIPGGGGGGGGGTSVVGSGGGGESGRWQTARPSHAVSRGDTGVDSPSTGSTGGGAGGDRDAPLGLARAGSGEDVTAAVTPVGASVAGGDSAAAGVGLGWHHRSRAGSEGGRGQAGGVTSGGGTPTGSGRGTRGGSTPAHTGSTLLPLDAPLRDLLPFRPTKTTMYAVHMGKSAALRATTRCVQLRIEVTDNGCGIGEDDLRNLWRPFVQIQAGVRQKGKGTGLGLTISKQIVQRHGGTVGVDSVVGTGSTFWLEVPLRILQRVDTPELPTGGGVGGGSGGIGSGGDGFTPSRGDTLASAAVPPPLYPLQSPPAQTPPPQQGAAASTVTVVIPVRPASTTFPPASGAAVPSPLVPMRGASPLNPVPAGGLATAGHLQYHVPTSAPGVLLVPFTEAAYGNMGGATMTGGGGSGGSGSGSGETGVIDAARRFAANQSSGGSGGGGGGGMGGGGGSGGGTPGSRRVPLLLQLSGDPAAADFNMYRPSDTTLLRLRSPQAGAKLAAVPSGGETLFAVPGGVAYHTHSSERVGDAPPSATRLATSALMPDTARSGATASTRAAVAGASTLAPPSATTAAAAGLADDRSTSGSSAAGGGPAPPAPPALPHAPAPVPAPFLSPASPTSVGSSTQMLSTVGGGSSLRTTTVSTGRTGTVTVVGMSNINLSSTTLPGAADGGTARAQLVSALSSPSMAEIAEEVLAPPGAHAGGTDTSGGGGGGGGIVLTARAVAAAPVSAAAPASIDPGGSGGGHAPSLAAPTAAFVGVGSEGVLAAAAVAAPGGVEGGAAVLVPRLRFLVVEDVHVNRHLLVRALNTRFYQCEIVEAENGAQAVEAMRSTLRAGGTFDMVCMDKEMPVMDGYQATNAIRAMGYGGLIVGVTGNALEADVEEFRSMGVNEVLTKPVNLDALVGVLYNAVPAARQSAEAATAAAAARRAARRPGGGLGTASTFSGSGGGFSGLSGSSGSGALTTAPGRVCSRFRTAAAPPPSPAPPHSPWHHPLALATQLYPLCVSAVCVYACVCARVCCM